MITHIHHIVPRHAGGSDDPSNLVSVTIEEHAELHFALYLEYGKVADWVAYHMLSGKTDEAELLRVELSREAMKSWVPTEEQRAKMSAASSRPKSEEFKKTMSLVRTGWKLSTETKDKISKAHSNRPKKTKKEKVFKSEKNAKISKSLMGHKNGGRRAKQVEYEGSVYSSMKELMRVTGMRKTTAYTLINTGKARYL